MSSRASARYPASRFRTGTIKGRCSPRRNDGLSSPPRSGPGTRVLAAAGARARICQTAVPAPSVTAEGLFQPPRAAFRGDLGVDQQRTVAWAVQPLAHLAEIAGPAHGNSRAAEPAPDLRDVGS